MSMGWLVQTAQPVPLPLLSHIPAPTMPARGEQHAQLVHQRIESPVAESDVQVWLATIDRTKHFGRGPRLVLAPQLCLG